MEQRVEQKSLTYEQALAALADRDERLVVMTAENRAAIRHLPEVLGDRFIDVGICEQTLIGAAAGLALRGRIPVVHALATFLTMRAFEFIRTDVGIAGLPVKLVGGFAGLISEANGPTHQALEDISLMRGIPGMNIWCPADRADLLIGLDSVLGSPAPCYIRYNDREPVVEHAEEFSSGKAEILAEGDDVTILSYGVLFEQCYLAARLLEKKRISVGLINMRMLKPLDANAVLEAASRSRLLVTVEDHFQIGGLYSIIAETLVEHRVTVSLLPLSFDARWFKPALFADVLAHEGFTAEALSQKIIERLGHVE